MELISSMQNQDIKKLRRLYKTQQRKRENKFILEGTRIIEQAIAAGSIPETVFIVPDYENVNLIKKMQQGQVKVRYISEKLLQKLSDTVTPQGIIAVVEERQIKPADFFYREINCLLVLDRVQDPGNMGTLIRTAAAAGIDGIVTLKGCVDIYNLKVIRATMGAIFSLPVLSRISVEEMLTYLQEKDMEIYCTDIDADTLYYQPLYQKPAVFIIGNEAHGISDQLLETADYRIKIPLAGGMESLNAAVSGAIVLYEYLRKNNDK